MRIGTGMAGVDSTLLAKRGTKEAGRRFGDLGYSQAVYTGNTAWGTSDRHLPGPGETEETADSPWSQLWGPEDDTGASSKSTGTRSEAEKIYQAAAAGKPNPYQSLRDMPKVPYGYLAKDGVIEYNGVVFVCDERTNSICLGDMTDEKNVLNIPLSGGGHLKVNRNSIGLLSKAAGMFSPEDLNLIMRAIAEDTKIQSVKKEIEDEEASVGNTLRGDGGAEPEEENPQDQV